MGGEEVVDLQQVVVALAERDLLRRDDLGQRLVVGGRDVQDRPGLGFAPAFVGLVEAVAPGVEGLQQRRVLVEQGREFVEVVDVAAVADAEEDARAGGTRVRAVAWAAASAKIAIARTRARSKPPPGHRPSFSGHSELLRIRGAAFGRHRYLHQLCLLPGCEHGLAEDVAEADQAGADERQGQMDQRARPAGDAADQVGHLVVAERLRPGQLVALASAGPVAVERGDHTAGRVGGPDRLEAGLPVPGDRQHREEGEAAQQRHPGVAAVVDDRGGEDGRVQRRGGDRALGQPLGAEEARALRRGRVERAEEGEALDPAALGGAQQAHRGQPVQLLDPVRRLVADRRRQVDHPVDPAQRLAHEIGVRHLAEVAERDLHVDPVGTEAARLADEAAHVLATLEQHRQQPRSDASSRPRQQQHPPNPRDPASLHAPA